MAFEKYNIDQFMAAWFDKNYVELSLEDFELVYSEYLDTSGLFMSEYFELQSLIHHLNSRINYINLFVRIQRDFISNFFIPFQRDFDRLKENYGYVVKWNGSVDDFEKQLKKIESRQIKHQSFLEEKIQELVKLRKENSGKKKFNGDDDKETEEDKDIKLKKSRVSFIRMLNSLGKIGYKLDKKLTTVEELALMIKQQIEEVEDYNSRINK